MHLLASRPSPHRDFCATLDSPMGLCSHLPSPIFFWPRIHIYWYFRIRLGNVALFAQCFLIQLPLRKNSISRSQKVELGRLVKIHIYKVLWNPQVMAALLIKTIALLWLVSFLLSFVPSHNPLCRFTCLFPSGHWDFTLPSAKGCGGRCAQSYALNLRTWTMTTKQATNLWRNDFIRAIPWGK